MVGFILISGRQEAAVCGGFNRRKNMNWDQIEGNWKTAKGKVKERWGKLTDDDLNVIAGKRDQLEGKLQKAYGKTKEQVKKDVDEFCSSCSC